MEYKKLELLQNIWGMKEPQKYSPTPSERIVYEKLESFLAESRAYNGMIICGEHGVGKTFTVRYFLSRKNLLDKAYINVNCAILKELTERKLPLTKNVEVYKAIRRLLEGESDVLVLDACEVFRFLDQRDFRALITQIHYSLKKVILVLPKEFDTGLPPSITIYLPLPSGNDFEVFFKNVGTKYEIPSHPIPFTELVKKVVSGK